MIETIRKAWTWVGLKPSKVVASNAFGNVIVRADDGALWRICPEELSCEVIARTEGEYNRLVEDERFVADWEMRDLVEIAREKLGALEPSRCYCLKIPGVFGGRYDRDNLATITRLEAIAFSGDVAEQIKDVPDGGEIELKVVWPPGA